MEINLWDIGGFYTTEGLRKNLPVDTIQGIEKSRIPNGVLIKPCWNYRIMDSGQWMVIG